jgi:hypothetical protein
MFHVKPFRFMPYGVLSPDTLNRRYEYLGLQIPQATQDTLLISVIQFAGKVIQQKSTQRHITVLLQTDLSQNETDCECLLLAA